jgi:hypothetical protein
MTSISRLPSGRRIMLAGQECAQLRVELFSLLDRSETYRTAIRGLLRTMWRAVPALPADHPRRYHFGTLRRLASSETADTALKRYVAKVERFVADDLHLVDRGQPATWAGDFVDARVAHSSDLSEDDELLAPILPWDPNDLPPEEDWHRSTVRIYVSCNGAVVQSQGEEPAFLPNRKPESMSFERWDELKQMARDAIDRQLEKLQSEYERQHGGKIQYLAPFLRDRFLLLPALVDYLVDARPLPSPIHPRWFQRLAQRIGFQGSIDNPV